MVIESKSQLVEAPQLVFTVRCHPQFLYQAAKTIGLNLNAVVQEDHDHALGDWGTRQASVSFPSFFCDQRLFVLVLAFLVRRGQPFEVVLTHKSPIKGEADSYAMIFPALDDHTMAILRSIDPNAADQMADLNQRIDVVLNRIRHLRFSEDFDGSYDMAQEEDPISFWPFKRESE